MNVRRLIVGSALLLGATAAVLGLLWTRPDAKGRTPQARRERTIDMSALTTARRLKVLAASPEEQEYARQAEKLANHEVDLAFANAMRMVAEAQPPATPEIEARTAARDKAEARVVADQKLIQRLGAEMAAADARKKDTLGDQLDVAKAQLELDQDELDTAAESLERAGGDPQARIQRLKAAHDAADQEAKTADAAAPEAAPSKLSPGSLAARFLAWRAERAKRTQLAQAIQEAQERIQRVEKWRQRVAQRVKDAQAEKGAARASATEIAKDGAATKDDARIALTVLKRFMADQRSLADLGKRLQDDQGLVEVYQNWIGVVDQRAMSALHEMVKGLLLVLGILASVFAGGLVVDHLFGRIAPDNLRLSTLRTVAKLAVQAVGLVLVLLVVVGIPSQTTTVLGLAGAGLTVALKDFIVAFFGWFQLMGRNGIRVGDWVEIKGVGGEVAEVGLMRTVLLETGGWSEAGHPTGRRVSFVNSFAVEGHFFNFTTSGQWMWDELQVPVPSGQDPFPLMDGIQALLEDRTKAYAEAAEQEWQKATSRYRVKSFTAVPGLSIVPTAAGLEIRVRFITRVYERHDMRRELNQALVELMHGTRTIQKGGGDDRA